ncbi:MAG: AsmA-like C-terminal region-containing protein, partial [Verrucomicrobiota bacterium]
ALGEVWSEIQFKQTEVKSLGVFGKFRDVAWEQVWQARTLELGQRFEGAITFNRLLNGVELVATEVRGPEMKTPVDLISLKASGEKLVTVSVEANAIWGDARVRADANLSLLGKRTSISASTRNLGITQLDTVESFRELGISSQIWGLDESRVDLETVLDFEGKWAQIQVHADTGPIAYKGLWLDNAWGEMTLFPDRVELHDFAFIGPFGSASGSLDFDWWSKDLALYISADAIPTSINPWMQEWWTRLWKPFSFDEENRPASDFYVNTTLGTKRSTDFFGRVAGAETAYNGVLFDSGSAKVWGKPRFTEAFDLRLSRDNEETAARLTWTFFPDRAGLMLAEYRLGGKVDLRTIDKIFPKTVQDITANFEPSGLVDLRVDGHNYGRTAKPEEKIRSEGGRVFASTESPIAAYGIQLDSMDMDASYGQAGLDISRIEFAAGGGTGNGQIQYFIEGSEASTPVLDVDVELDGLRRDRIFSVLPMLKTEDTPESPDDGGNARITLNLQAEGDPRDRFSFYGSGRARMSGGNLNDIGVFGGLSKTLSDTAFPVGSLSLNEIQSPVNIRGGLLEFKNIKGSGRGVRLRGDGVYQMEQDHMNFKINVSPGNMSVTPVYSLLTAILRPVASVFPIRVWGPINSPNWALDFFTSQAEVEAPALEPVFDLSPPINLGEISDEPLEDSKIGVGESISSGDLGDPMSTPQKSE